MATSNRTIEHLLELYQGDRDLTARKMFGEYAFYLDGKLVALVCDDRLFVKPLDEARALLGEESEEAAPYPGAKLHLAPTDRVVSKPAQLTALLELLWNILPIPKPKAKTEKAKRM